MRPGGPRQQRHPDDPDHPRPVSTGSTGPARRGSHLCPLPGQVTAGMSTRVLPRSRMPYMLGLAWVSRRSITVHVSGKTPMDRS